MSFLRHDQKIFVAGHTGLVGSAITKALLNKGYKNLVTRSFDQLDLRNQDAVENFFATESPNAVFLAAAKVGGIHANNTYRADFIYENLQIQNNVIWAAHKHNVERLVFLGSSCIYPRMCPQPMKEEHLLSGDLEYTNRPYALAKIAGLELVNAIRQQYGRDWFSVMPTNQYGPGDNYHPENSHVLPALIRRFEEARVTKAPQVTVWGTGKPRREFMYSLDCAAAIVHLAELPNLSSVFSSEFQNKWSHINIGVGTDVSISELAHQVADAVGFKGTIVFDPTKPDGTPKKLQDVSLLLKLGYSASTSLQEGLKSAVADFRANYNVSL
jgi:GDP-L-fucose synthase